MIRTIVFLNLLTISGNSFATECAGFNEAFNSLYDVFAYSSQEVWIRDTHNPKNLNKVITIGTEFQGHKDRHGQVQYVLKSIKQNKVKFEYISKFDARSFDGSLKTCSGMITIEI